MSTEPSRKPSEFHNCVTFRSETDGRSNFPTQGDFHAFCKQRDLFYSIKNAFIQKSSKHEDVSVSQTNFGRSNYPRKSFPLPKFPPPREVDPLCEKVKALFQINSGWANLSHLASLFTEQYVIDSLEESRTLPSPITDILVQDELMGLLEKSNSNMDRLEKLNNRMTSKSKEEHEDCFKFQQYFIKTAASPAFNQHLIDRVTFEIREIESSLDTGLSDGYEYLLRRSVLLSKLLGHVIFLPYREIAAAGREGGPTLDKETFSTRQLKLRHYQNPPLELEKMLLTSLKRSRLIFTLPWTIELLSAADSISLQLPAYKNILVILCTFYKDLLAVNGDSRISLKNKNYLRFLCENFFKSNNFPEAILYGKLPTIIEILSENMTLDDRPKAKKDEDLLVLDFKDDIGEKLTRLYLSKNFSQMKYTLHSGLQQQSSPFDVAETVRHIRPMPAANNHPVHSKPVTSPEAELQKQLESSFFDGHSPSVKRTIDFISERIASNYVKQLRKMMIDQRNELALSRIFGEAAAAHCKTEMFGGITEFIDDKCQVSVNVLIGESISSAALLICQKIAHRMATDKIGQWINTHIKGELFPEITEDASQTTTNEDPGKLPPAKEIKKKEELASFSSLISLHRSIKRLHERKPISPSTVDEILNCQSFGTTNGLQTTLLDFGIALITFYPSLLDQERLLKLIEIWKPQWGPNSQILCPRNILILKSSQNETLSWSKLESLISILLQQGILDFKTFEQDCFRLLREELSPKESEKLSHLLRQVLARSNSGEVSREVVDWISWYCSGAEDAEQF